MKGDVSSKNSRKNFLKTRDGGFAPHDIWQQARLRKGSGIREGERDGSANSRFGREGGAAESCTDGSPETAAPKQQA